MGAHSEERKKEAEMSKVRVVEALKKARVLIAGVVLERQMSGRAFTVMASVEALLTQQIEVAEAQAKALTEAERFILGFEGDELQEGIEELLSQIRAVI
jgi:hypothetical protein